MTRPEADATPTDPEGARTIVGLAQRALLASHGQFIAKTRETLADRELHVDRGLHHLRLAQAAQADAVRLEEQSRERVVRPRWLTSRTHTVAKLLLVISEISAGTSALYTAGDALPLAILIFTGVAIGTVLAGTHIGIQIRRREQDEHASLIPTAILAVVLATAMLLVTRYWTVGTESAVLAFVTTMVALGSAFLGYQWHDPVADALIRANDLHEDLNARAMREFQHRRVKEFEAAEAALRPATVEALQRAYATSTRPTSALSELIGGEGDRARSGHLPAPDRGMVDTLLEMLVGPEILSLTPKVEK